ncbi:MAG TPA: hypothetical protein PK753_11080 [Ignavibacteria bacterium]|nr:hypothetical protein [Ignavibacteria bacterium]
MKPKNDLKLLIDSLSPTEKAYFRKFSGRHFKEESTFRKLFDAIDSTKSGSVNYSEDHIKEKFRNEKFIKQLPVTKIYLYNNILKSLNLYYAEDSIDLKLNLLINNANILYKKGLYTQSIKMISKAKAMAEKYDKPIKLLESIQAERLALRVNSSLNEVSTELMRNYEEEQKVLEKMKNISDYRKLYDMMVIHATAKGIEAGSEPGNTFEKLLSNRLLRNYENARYFQSKVIFLLMHCFINNLTGNKSAACSYGLECLELIGDSERNKKAASYEYILILQEMMQITYAEGRAGESETYFARLMQEQEKLLGDSPLKIQNFLKLRSLMGKLNINSAGGKHENNLEVIRELIDITKKNEASSFRDEVIVTDFIAVSVYFANSMYDDSLFHINRIFNSKAFELREDIQVSCRIINLLIHYELGNMGSLEYYIRSTYRYLKKRKELTGFERLVFEFLKRGQRVSDTKEMKDLFSETRNKLRKEIESEPGMLQVIDLDAWLDSKIQNRSYLEIIKRRNTKG